MEHQTELDLKKMACKIRMGIVEGTHAAKAGHLGGSLSAALLKQFGLSAEHITEVLQQL